MLRYVTVQDLIVPLLVSLLQFGRFFRRKNATGNGGAYGRKLAPK